MKTAATFYLRKRDPDQHLWRYLEEAGAQSGAPVAVLYLADAERVLVNEEGARRALAFFRILGFADDETANLRTPVEVVDYDGRPLQLEELAAA